MPSRQKKVTQMESAQLADRVAELERRVARLQRAARKQAGQKRSGFITFIRQLAVVLLVILCAASATLSASSIWVKRNIMNTDVWVEKTSQLIQDPSIRSSISTALADQIFTQLGVETQLKQILPERISGLSSALSNNLKSAVKGKVDDVIASEAFGEAWAKANRSAHNGILESVKNGGATSESLKRTAVMYIDSRQLVLNLRPVFAEIQSRLVGSGLGFVGSINVGSIGGQINLVTIQHMSIVLLAINLIDRATFLLPVLAILFGAAAIALSTNRRRTLIAIGCTVAILMVVLVQLVNIARYSFVDISGAIQTTTALAAYNIMTDDLVLTGRTFLVIALLLVVAGFMSGASKPAVYLRDQLAKLLRVDGNQPAFIRWVGSNTGYTLAGISILAAFLLVFPLARGSVYPVTVVSIAVILSLIVVTIRQGSSAR